MTVQTQLDERNAKKGGDLKERGRRKLGRNLEGRN